MTLQLALPSMITSMIKITRIIMIKNDKNNNNHNNNNNANTNNNNDSHRHSQTVSGDARNWPSLRVACDVISRRCVVWGLGFGVWGLGFEV